ncbi:MAG: phosphoribosylamine--glycine ligase [Angelakisella sp.]|jgi:phosphoribosylamine--glycine ligase|nr:phosphoribosylamine--glycine ligase [Angelakisella sp.]MCI9529261.1 phosphoribosylamine--glycine ligase [Angelakisella sp.]
MRVLVIGGGGREHAIIRKLKESPRATQLFAMPGNAGIAQDAVCIPGSANDVEAIVAAAKEYEADLVVVAPDDPLVLGAVDKLREAGIPAFGPDAAAAAIEGSKAFAKDLMKRYGIPTADYQVFHDPAAALACVAQAPLPVVVKASGLALGKGVLICHTRQEAENAVRSMMEEKIFGESGSEIVVEEFLTGPEVSVLCFTDGETILPMASSMDHKRALDGDKGLNTGGMGTIAPNPCYTPAIAAQCMEKILRPTVTAMNLEGRTFRGCLYFGLMLTPQGPKVIEYNCRFGDPETQVVLPLLSGDLLEIMLATAEGRLREVEMGVRPGCACCVVLASGGYPGSYQKGKAITGLDEKGQPASPEAEAQVFHAGTAAGENGGFVTAGGRVLGVTATGETLQEAIRRAYAAARGIRWEGVQLRGDIGSRALAALPPKKACPLCGQGPIHRAVVKKTGEALCVCEECDTVWKKGGAGDTVTNLTACLEEQGVPPRWEELALLTTLDKTDTL